jgi:hypothetical protein
MAKAPTVGFLPGNDPEAFMANQEYQAALNRMEQALNARQNRFFDPSMLALAQGFLAPTQTGGFGESLGFAAKNVREAQAGEEKEERDIAEARLGLAGRGIELERLRLRDREFAKLMGPETPGAPATGPLSRQQPAGPLSVAPKGFEGVQGIPVAPPNPNFMTGRQYLGMARLDPSIAPTTAIKDATKLEQDRYQVKEGGVQDLSSGMFYPFPKGELVERQIFGYDGVYKVDARTAALLDMYAANGDSRYYEVAKRAVEGPKAPPKPGETAPEGKVPGKISSVAETEGEKAGAIETAQSRAKAQEKDRADTIKAGSDAPSRLGVYNQLDKIASGQNAGLIFGIFERPDIFSNVMKLIETGVGTPGFSVGIPAIRDILTNAGLDQKMINQSQFAISLMANIQLQMSRLQEGQGAVSDFERTLFASAAIARTDNPDVIRAKLDLLRARAEFDREVAKAVRTYKGSIDDFKSGDDYANMVQRYEEKLGGIIENRLGGTVPERPSSPAPKGRDNKGAAGRLPI